MFNFFDEIISKSTIRKDFIQEFNLVNISGHLLYVEGHKGLTVLTRDLIAFKINKGRVEVLGENMKLSELTSNTILIEGKIVKTEIVS